MSLLEILTWAQLAVLCPLAILGLHRGWMVLLCLRKAPDEPKAEPDASAQPPRITVQLPIFNERFVARRLIESVAALDYPHDRFEIQILDDSTDDTTNIIRSCLHGLPPDLDVTHVRRTKRTHFKAGALGAGLEQAKGELIAIFDADFIPAPDFLRKAAKHFDDPSIGLVQCRWDHLNTDSSLLTRTQALLLDGHFAVEHLARVRAGAFFNFNGTAGIFRRKCIDDAGGWQGDTLTEDMDLSYRAQLKGWRFAYRPEIGCPAELPVDMNAFVTQQHRWAKGSIQTAKKLLGTVWRSRQPLIVKVEASFHMLGNLAFPLLLALILLALPIQILRLVHGVEIPTWLAILEGIPLLAATAGVLAFYTLAQLRFRGLHAGTIARIPLVLAIGAGLSVSNTAAVIAGMFGETGEFRRTPKNESAARRTNAAPPSYRARRGAAPFLEIGLGCCAVSTSVVAFGLGLPLTAVFHALFAGGLLWVSSTSVAEDRQEFVAARVQAKTP